MDGRTILVVEDDDDSRADFGAVLREHGYRVGLAANGQQALDHIQTYGPPDLILLDMALPVVDGWHFLRQRDARTARVPFLILTALGTATNPWAASLGAAGWLRKPIDPCQLLEKVGGLVRLTGNGGTR